MEKYVEQAFCHIKLAYRGTGLVRVCQSFGRAMGEDRLLCCRILEATWYQPMISIPNCLVPRYQYRA